MANRKKQAKLDKVKPEPIHIYDQTETWLRGDFHAPPWSQEKIDAFQKRIDSAFGAENAIVLAWSGDRSYGDAFLNEKGELERKPVLLFAETKINETDYHYASVPRWVLMEVHHGSELEDGWDEAAHVVDNHGACLRIRPEKPPKHFYVHLKTIAQHNIPVNSGLMPQCCANMIAQKRICYGKYKLPSDEDIAYVGRIRARMDKDGVAQRNDTARSIKLLQNATSATQHFIKKAQEQRAFATQQHILENLDTFTKDILEKKGSTMSYKEVHDIAKEAFDQQNESRFG